MSHLERVDHYGFPIGLSIDFRRAMHRFEAAAESSPPDHSQLRKARTLLIDGRPADALRELATPTIGAADKALVDLARRQLRGHEALATATAAPSAGARPRANVVLPLPVQYGGMRVQVGIARALATAGFDVHVLQMRNSGEGEPVDPTPFRRVVDIEDQADLHRELSAERAALTFVGCWVDYPPAVEAGTAPVVGYSGGEPTLNEDSKLDDRMLAFRRAAHQLPVHLVTCSRFVQRLYCRKFGRTSSYVPVALDDRAFRTRAHGAAPDAPTTRVLLLAWDGIEDKGLDYAIPALENIRKAGRDIRIVWITPKPPVKFTNLDCELHVDPPKDELYQLIGDCDALVYPPIVDGLGLPPLEAMAAGVPVVVSTGTGPDEFARDGMNAICVPPKSVGAIEQAVLRLLDNSDLARSLGVRGRATASRYHSATTTSALLDVVAQVIRHDAEAGSPDRVAFGGAP